MPWTAPRRMPRSPKMSERYSCSSVVWNVYGDPRGMSRPWPLDPVPLLVAPADAAALEAGLTQRAKLLELVLADLYGPQHLLRDGALPRELVYPNPGFLRPCHGITPPGGRFLHLYAANLGRGADGTWRVLGDRTQQGAENLELDVHTRVTVHAGPSLTPTHPGGMYSVAPASSIRPGPFETRRALRGRSKSGPGVTCAVRTATSSTSRPRSAKP